MKKDAVDRIIEQWKVEIPGLNTNSMAVLGRLQQVAKYAERRLAKNFELQQLNSGEFDVLATLLRSGGKYRLKPTDLYRSLMITSGAMTNRIDTLEKKGLVKRVHDTLDRRAVFVELTKKGYERINQDVFSHTKVEDELLSSLTAKEKEELNTLLKKLLSSFQESDFLSPSEKEN